MDCRDEKSVPGKVDQGLEVLGRVGAERPFRAHRWFIL